MSGIMNTTKKGEYYRTLEMISARISDVDLYGNGPDTRRDIMFMLYLLADSGYGNKDLLAMAKLLQEDLKE